MIGQSHPTSTSLYVVRTANSYVLISMNSLTMAPLCSYVCDSDRFTLDLYRHPTNNLFAMPSFSAMALMRNSATAASRTLEHRTSILRFGRSSGIRLLLLLLLLLPCLSRCSLTLMSFMKIFRMYATLMMSLEVTISVWFLVFLIFF